MSAAYIRQLEHEVDELRKARDEALELRDEALERAEENQVMTEDWYAMKDRAEKAEARVRTLETRKTAS